MTGHMCPECGMDSGPGGRTGARSACGCGRPAAEQHLVAGQYRAAEQHRIERSAVDPAEIAAAEDFDPLRIRPYVTLGNDTVPAAVEERPDRSGRSGSHLPVEEGPGARLPMEDAATTMPLFLGRDPAGGPRPDTVGPADPSGPLDDQEPEPSHRRRPFAAAAVGAALIAVVGAAAFASGLLGGGGNGDADQRQALPGTVADVPGASVRATGKRPPCRPRAPRRLPRRPPHPPRPRSRPRQAPRRLPPRPRPPPSRPRPRPRGPRAAHRRPRRRPRPWPEPRCTPATRAPRWPSCNAAWRSCGCTPGATTAPTRTRSSAR